MDLFDFAKDKMFLIFQLNHCKKYHLFHLESTLFDHGLKYFYYPTPIMKLVLKYEYFK